jgi:hypothetical protein
LFSQRWAIAVAVLAYVAVLHLIYQLSIAPAFSYLRYAYREPDPATYGIAISLVVALALILPRRISQPSQFIAWTLFIVAIVPSIVVPQFADALSTLDAMEVAIWVAVSFLPVAAFGTRRAVRGVLPSFRLSPSAFWPGLAVVSAVVYAYVLATVGLRWQLPSLADVYGVRDEFQVVEDSSSGLLGYAVPLLANVLNPLIVTRGLFAKRWIWLLTGVLGQVFIFSFTGYRSAILSPVALIGAYLLFRRSSRPASIVVLISVVSLALGMWAMDWLTSSLEYTSLLVRRFLITPGLLTAGYVAVFSDIDKVFLSHSFLSPFSEYPYAQEPPLLVGAEFFGDASTNANANLLADGYANFGFPGMLLECLVLVLLLWAIDDACRGISVRISSLVFVMPTLALADSGIFTTMLTHGLVAAIVVCMLMPRTGWERPARSSPPRTATRRWRPRTPDVSGHPATKAPRRYGTS